MSTRAGSWWIAIGVALVTASCGAADGTSESGAVVPPTTSVRPAPPLDEADADVNDPGDRQSSIGPDTGFVLDVISAYSADERFGAMWVDEDRTVRLRVTGPSGQSLADEILRDVDQPLVVGAGGASYAELLDLVEEAQELGYIGQPDERRGTVTVYGIEDPSAYPTQSPNLRFESGPLPEESGEELSG